MRSPAPFYGSFLTKHPTLPERSLMFPVADRAFDAIIQLAPPSARKSVFPMSGIFFRNPMPGSTAASPPARERRIPPPSVHHNPAGQTASPNPSRDCEGAWDTAHDISCTTEIRSFMRSTFSSQTHQGASSRKRYSPLRSHRLDSILAKCKDG